MSKILVVDEEIDILEVTKKFFNKRGFDVFIASNGMEAFRLIKDENPDLVLLDFNLPGMNGVEVLKKTRESKLDTKIIMVTGFDTEKVINETKGLGIQDYVHKPLDLDKLEKIVIAALNTSSQNNS